MSDSSEIWRDVPGYEGCYQVSNLGRVKSLARLVACKDPWGGIRMYPVKEKIKKLCRRTNGYRFTTLWSPESQKCANVHRLVLLAFVGPCPEGMEGCHNDGDKDNNQLSNLRWDTPESNLEDLEKHGRRIRGSKVAGSKLTEEDVSEIRRRYKRRQKPNGYVSIAKAFGVSAVTISAIVNRRTWKHVK